MATQLCLGLQFTFPRALLLNQGIIWPIGPSEFHLRADTFPQPPLIRSNPLRIAKTVNYRYQSFYEANADLILFMQRCYFDCKTLLHNPPPTKRLHKIELISTSQHFVPKWNDIGYTYWGYFLQLFTRSIEKKMLQIKNVLLVPLVNHYQMLLDLQQFKQDFSVLTFSKAKFLIRQNLALRLYTERPL